MKHKRPNEDRIRQLLDEIATAEHFKRTAWLRERSFNRQVDRALAKARREYRELTQGPGWSEREWDALKKKYDHRCVCCSRPDVRLVPDHIHPLESGGRHEICNIQPLCVKCNFAKGVTIRDHRPVNIRQWLRAITQCVYGRLATRCKNTALRGGTYCAKHERQRDERLSY